VQIGCPTARLGWNRRTSLTLHYHQEPSPLSTTSNGNFHVCELRSVTHDTDQHALMLSGIWYVSGRDQPKLGDICEPSTSSLTLYESAAGVAEATKVRPQPKEHEMEVLRLGLYDFHVKRECAVSFARKERKSVTAAVITRS
jgi:hypothetical protein